MTQSKFVKLNKQNKEKLPAVEVEVERDGFKKPRTHRALI